MISIAIGLKLDHDPITRALDYASRESSNSMRVGTLA